MPPVALRYGAKHLWLLRYSRRQARHSSGLMRVGGSSCRSAESEGLLAVVEGPWAWGVSAEDGGCAGTLGAAGAPAGREGLAGAVVTVCRLTPFAEDGGGLSEK